MKKRDRQTYGGGSVEQAVVEWGTLTRRSVAGRSFSARTLALATALITTAATSLFKREALIARAPVVC